MPVKIPNALPAAATLKQENIFVMTEQRATTQDIRPLRIAILNLMPTKVATETQLLRVLGNSPLQVEPVFIRTASYTSTHISQEYMDTFYRTFDQVRDQKFDGCIITGAPVELMKYEDVAYWDELVAIMDWANSNVFSTFYICWGAQAALYHMYGIPKYTLPEKKFGVYRHKVLVKNCRLMRGFDDYFYAPHSRHTEVRTEDIEACEDLIVLAKSDEAGVLLCMSRDGSRIFMMGHPEYDRVTLDREYKRDKAKGMDIDLPVNYYPGDDETKKPLLQWRSHGNLLYTNWLNYYVYQKTPYRWPGDLPDGQAKK